MHLYNIVFAIGQSVVEGRFGLRKVPLHSNACSLLDSVPLCSATSRTAMRPSTTGNPCVLLSSEAQSPALICQPFWVFVMSTYITAIYLSDAYFDRCTTCCTAPGCRHGSIPRCMPSDHTLTYGYMLFLLVCMRMFYRQTR